MKQFKLLCTIALVAIFSVSASAQSDTFKPFKVDLSFGFASPAGSGSKGGVLIAVEPKYALNDKITLGLRLESAIMGRAFIEGAGVDLKASGAYVAHADYYFNTKKFRPFAGLGAGIYTIAGADFSETTVIGGSTITIDGSVEAQSKFGFAPRIGFEFGHFRLAAEYNAIGKTEEMNNSYLGFKAGFFFGGGRK